MSTIIISAFIICKKRTLHNSFWKRRSKFNSNDICDGFTYELHSHVTPRSVADGIFPCSKTTTMICSLDVFPVKTVRKTTVQVHCDADYIRGRQVDESRRERRRRRRRDGPLLHNNILPVGFHSAVAATSSKRGGKNSTKSSVLLDVCSLLSRARFGRLMWER